MIAPAPIVYVVQQQFTLNPSTRALVPKFDLVQALEYGELRYLIGPRGGPYNIGAILDDLRSGLAAYRPGMDYLLLVGNPCIIGLACVVAAQAGNPIKLLQWASKEQKYIEIVVAV